MNDLSQGVTVTDNPAGEPRWRTPLYVGGAVVLVVLALASLVKPELFAYRFSPVKGLPTDDYVRGALAVARILWAPFIAVALILFAGIALDGDDFDEPVYRSFGGPSFDTFSSGSSWVSPTTSTVNTVELSSAGIVRVLWKLVSISSPSTSPPIV